MYIYRLTGRVRIWPFGGDLEEPAFVHVLAVNVVWPDPLSEEEVTEHAMQDLLADFEYGDAAEWAWTIGPTVRPVSEAEIMRAAGVPGPFGGEVGDG